LFAFGNSKGLKINAVALKLNEIELQKADEVKSCGFVRKMHTTIWIGARSKIFTFWQGIWILPMLPRSGQSNSIGPSSSKRFIMEVGQLKIVKISFVESNPPQNSLITKSSWIWWTRSVQDVTKLIRKDLNPFLRYNYINY